MKKIILLLIIMFSFYNCYADDIVIDGNFSDWVDKPSINESDIASETDNKAEKKAESDKAQIEPQTNTEQADAKDDVSDADVITNTAQEQAEVSNAIDGTASQDAAVSTQEETQGPVDNQNQNAQQSPADVEIDNSKEQKKEDDNGPKYKISQLKWNMSDNSDLLYIMIRISHSNDAQSTEITTEMLTDYGNFNIRTNYDINDNTVFTSIDGTNITSNEGSCSIINKETVYMEYAIPVSELIKDMKWGYMIKFKVHTEDDTEPKNDYIIVSTANSGPYAGVAIGALAACAGFYYTRRKKRT